MCVLHIFVMKLIQIAAASSLIQHCCSLMHCSQYSIIMQTHIHIMFVEGVGMTKLRVSYGFLLPKASIDILPKR